MGLLRRQRVRKLHKSRRKFKKGKRLRLYKFNKSRIYPVNTLKRVGYLKFFTKKSIKLKIKRRIGLSKLFKNRRLLRLKKSFFYKKRKIKTTSITKHSIRRGKLGLRYRKPTIKRAPLESKFLMNDLISLDLLGFYSIVEPTSSTISSKIKHP